MSQKWARFALMGYRWLGAGLYPFLGPYLAIRAAKGKEEHHRRRERYGHASEKRPAGPLVWFHAASVGETAAVIPLILEIRSRSIDVILTTGTVTSSAIVRDRLGDAVIHQYVPLDLKPAINRFLEFWKPDLAIIAESEIWPMTILELGARRMPQVIVNARLSDKSFNMWHKMPKLAEALFENISHVIAQSKSDAERFNVLGARPVSVSGNLKVDVEVPSYKAAELSQCKLDIGKRLTWAAISTHKGEEEIAGNIHLELKKQHKVVTIIVPRHPERGASIAEMLRSKGLKVARRSLAENITPETDIYLGDTIGDMGLYLNLSEIVFVGKSLTGKGGQNPIEPAMVNCAVLSGTNIQNFRSVYSELLDKGAAKLVRDEQMLLKAVKWLMENKHERHKMAAAGRACVENMSGSLEKTIRALEPYIKPLTIQAKLQASQTRNKDE